LTHTKTKLYGLEVSRRWSSAEYRTDIPHEAVKMVFEIHYCYTIILTAT